MGKRIWAKRHQRQRRGVWIHHDGHGPLHAGNVVDKSKRSILLNRLGAPEDVVNAGVFCPVTNRITSTAIYCTLMDVIVKP